MKYFLNSIILLGLFASCSLGIKDDDRNSGATITTNKTASIEGYVVLSDAKLMAKRVSEFDSIISVRVFAYVGDSAFGYDETDSHGFFRIENLPLLEYRIVAKHPTSAEIEVGVVNLKSDIIIEEPITFSSNISSMGCQKLSVEGTSLALFPDSGNSNRLFEYDSLILTNINGMLQSSIYKLGSYEPELTDWPIVSESDTYFGRVSSMQYNVKYELESNSCNLLMHYSYDSTLVWEGGYHFVESCERFSKHDYSALFKLDSGISKFDIYDSMLVEKSGDSILSKIWMRGGDIPEISEYSTVSQDSLIGRNATLKYDMAVKFDSKCRMRMNYRYDSKGYWEETSRWKLSH